MMDRKAQRRARLMQWLRRRAAAMLRVALAMAVTVLFAPKLCADRETCAEASRCLRFARVGDPQVCAGRAQHRLRAHEFRHQDGTGRAASSGWLEPTANMRVLCRAPRRARRRVGRPTEAAWRILGKGTDGSTQLFVYWAESGATAAISNFTESPSGLAWVAGRPLDGIHHAGWRLNANL